MEDRADEDVKLTLLQDEYTTKGSSSASVPACVFDLSESSTVATEISGDGNISSLLTFSALTATTSYIKGPITQPSSFIAGIKGTPSPKPTKTGKISRSQKGVRGAHSCACGKVSL